MFVTLNVPSIPVVGMFARMYSSPSTSFINGGIYSDTSYFLPRTLVLSFVPSSFKGRLPSYLVVACPIISPVSRSLRSITTAPVGGSPRGVPDALIPQPFATVVVTSSFSPLIDVPPDTVRVAAVLSFPAVPPVISPNSLYVTLENSFVKVLFLITFSTPKD